jgi:AMP nucleosidase
MKTKEEIVNNWLPRYTDTPLREFGKYILLVNFEDYLHMFSEWYNVPIRGVERPMPNVTAEGITLINFGMGSPNAATVMDLLGAVKPLACLLLGKCGGLKRKNALGDLILPIAAIRGEGTSNDYFPPEVLPCLPSTCRKPSQPPSATTNGTIGQAPCTRPTAASGSTMRNSSPTCA